MNEHSENSADPAAAFQKIWTESLSKLMQTAFTSGPDSAPPELVRQIRSGIFKALADSWEEFMRSPQFLEGMRQWMESAIAFRKMTNDFMAKVRNEVQAPSREDIDTVLLSVRHMEKRLLDRVDELAHQIEALQQHKDQPGNSTGRKAAAANPGRTAKRTSKKPKRARS